MIPFESCLAALKQPGPPEALFKAVDKALAEGVGHKLFTLLYVAPDGKRVIPIGDFSRWVKLSP